MIKLKAFALFSVTSLFMGCASAPKVVNMILRDCNLQFSSTGKTLKIGTATGGEESTAWAGSKISAADFNQAVRESLQNSGLFKTVTFQNGSDYILTASLLNQDQPEIGLDMTVSLTVVFTIVDNSTGEKVFNEVITRSYTATWGDAFVGATRLSKANEGAVRENIKGLLYLLSKTKL